MVLDGAKQALPSYIRTQGDGMENEPEIKNDAVHVKRDKNSLGDRLIYRPPDFKHFTATPPVITGKIVNLVPKTVTHTKKDKVILGNLKGKEPKFVPYEPYKAAVKPIIPYEKKGKTGERKTSQKSIDLKIVVTNVPGVHEGTTDHENNRETANEGQINIALEERKAMEDEIKTLKEENGQLESQLKFQAQVNGELKNLLVAAMGEDLETRVHVLTEDKLQLARALLNSAQRLSTHQEQTEWLAGQCEVWRSKFLASSLMVEELARWKAALSQRATDLQEALKRVLEERGKAREFLLNTYRNLSVLRENFDHTYSITRRPDVASTNILDLAAGITRLSDTLRHILLGSSSRQTRAEPDFTGLDMSTCAEKTAESLLANPMPLLLSDAACSAVMGAAVAVSGHMLVRPSIPACCGHCSGEIKLV
ncbi:golgin-45 isoform X3 [Zootermopsis nevadensis]|uniref:golgin-45 isoform X2 n=1 Tax=Zootermopsis nevadensis TaxID=136037 RepID=UPI000B8E5165|nr:golgin-45 isoform X2 [Zootermopsis nevadensis]XP_021918386.1 golgin-45 isoform X3 [Zootermopsis nevadensis]